MAARTGEQYLAGLKDQRSVWVNGEAVTDVACHPGFKGSLAGMAGYFDWQHRYILSRVAGKTSSAGARVCRNWRATASACLAARRIT
jgi:aromatic ring hydroxylase